MPAWIFAAMLLGSAPAAAQPASEGSAADRLAEGRARFEHGVQHYEHGRFDEAAVEFEAAYALTREPELLYNVYVAHRDAAHDAAAAEALRGYLASGVVIENRELLEQRLRALDERLRSERAARRTEREPELASRAPLAEDPDSTLLPWALTGAATVSGIAAVVLALQARSTHAQLEDACPGGACPPSSAGDIDALRTETFAADVFGVASLVILATAAVLFILSD